VNGAIVKSCEVAYLSFFSETPRAIPLYEAIRDFICTEFADVNIKVSKTQISFSNRYGFAFVSLPYRKVKGRPAVYVILTFGLGYKLEHPRIAESVEPYPGRWTHHVIIQSVDEIDGQVKGWLKEAYTFANEKRRRRYL